MANDIRAVCRAAYHTPACRRPTIASDNADTAAAQQAELPLNDHGFGVRYLYFRCFGCLRLVRFAQRLVILHVKVRQSLVIFFEAGHCLPQQKPDRIYYWYIRERVVSFS